MKQRTLGVYTVQKIDNYHVVAISAEIYQTLHLKENKLKLILKQDRVVLEGQRSRLGRRPPSSTAGVEVDTVAKP